MPNQDHSSAASERKFSQTVVGLVALGFVAVLAACLGALLVMKRGQEHTNWVNHTYLVERHVSGIRLSLEEMRSARRGMMLRMPEASSDRYRNARRQLESEITAVDALTQDNPLQQANVRELRGEAHVLDSLGPTFLAGARIEGFQQEEQARFAVAQRLTLIAQRMLAEERRLLVEREAAQRSSLQTFYSVLGLVAVLLLLVGGASIWVILRYTRDLSRTRDELRQLNDNLEDAVQVRTRDLQRANDEIQRFAYIVSHDLRSPLVNVMGFTSELEAAIRPLSQLVEQATARDPALVSNDAKLAVQEDLPEALGFIRASTQKMDRLINAILRLSREGRRNITPVPVELTPLATSIVDGIRHLVDERGARVDVQEGMPTITTDRLALEQIISNLVENALKYEAPGRPGEIKVTAHESRGRVYIRIVDNGRGIDPRDHSTLR